MPRTKRVGSAQPAWKIQVTRTISFPIMRVVAGGDNGGGVAMVVTKADEKGRERYFEYEEPMLK